MSKKIVLSNLSSYYINHVHTKIQIFTSIFFKGRITKQTPNKSTITIYIFFKFMPNLRTTPNAIIYSLCKLIQKLTWYLSLLALNTNTLRGCSTPKPCLYICFTTKENFSIFIAMADTIYYPLITGSHNACFLFFSVDLTQSRCSTLFFALSTLSLVLFTWIS